MGLIETSCSKAPLAADPLSLGEIVENGLCIGCGLCRSMARPGDVEMVMTPEGRERPVALRALEKQTLERINAVCPGTRIAGPPPAQINDAVSTDTVWGPVERLVLGSAADPTVRFVGSGGGTLTALGQFLLSSGRVKFVLHVAASRSMPMRTERKLSFDAASVLEGAGSRYGPAATLVDFNDILDRGEPFALIAKPCDITAARNLARLDPRVDKHMRYALAFVCGGASDLTKSEQVLQRFGLREDELSLFRYRGHGNPGFNRIETKDGRAFEISYRQLWEDEDKWMIQPRCKICPDAIGQVADIAVSDAWLNGGPAIEDEPLNGIIVRTKRGLELFEAAVEAGALQIKRESGIAEISELQSHQVRKRRAVWARLTGMAIAGKPVPFVSDLALRDCAAQNSPAENLAEGRGARNRARRGRLGEPPAVPR
ncbi:Coenzyme F420 hydrogenase/dehydrogenase, beta subunit C-terminal domain [Mesorhizobium sp.]|uniref:Coenzyme F420 hydrogenase/dehydrogenase, beta subunit C-terminal domain n=1 Tax=Mesorhizobium sp. TaxID=1871066 RepID=UPI000FE2D32D|nr:Coenzyme F420 hydrogenase/dehydrogenase, beta subunit C-terminal domain [Mesorhizobium sp.]RWH71062.1 MAG: coenzyme F420 hydrogenase [Mesorhizobium sp.]RWL22413.1 MAG: coenzyme F420 hydrogenase [Mesorhizobium sp.]RWL31538.1 MAG: coenzyme F420 hydrogenase [Mesorhizobium sp.]RWL32714.1 MAG: coenzyme F420 hydrogenase [Mesorhizobium sp.]RWL48226.1 MAG: coenzyme F420 hydrogenase [Mesorhizobium sp.]